MVYNSIKVFTATKARDRVGLGESVTRWIRDRDNEDCEIVNAKVTQSSDKEFHCLTITLFYIRP